MTTTIQLNPGLTWQNLPKTQISQLLKQDALTARLTILAEQWREAAQGKAFNEIKVNLGLILADFCALLGLDEQETQRILGAEEVVSELTEVEQ